MSPSTAEVLEQANNLSSSHARNQPRSVPPQNLTHLTALNNLRPNDNRTVNTSFLLKIWIER